ncbi:MAG: hypothetical protein CMN15_08125 [Roseovarius sp.]|nr:hypothetical protein [Roseovarius sp.]
MCGFDIDSLRQTRITGIVNKTAQLVLTRLASELGFNQFECDRVTPKTEGHAEQTRRSTLAHLFRTKRSEVVPGESMLSPDQVFLPTKDPSQG